MAYVIALAIGVGVGIGLYAAIGWWGFLVVFPWIGAGIAIGIAIQAHVAKSRKALGRRVAILLCAPALLFFVPLVNNENFQLEGVVLIVLVGYFSKGFIHYAVAKLFGPLIWSRGFCGWACWSAAVMEWLPMSGKRRSVPPGARRWRYVVLAISIAIPVALIYGWGYDVRGAYISKVEARWMFASNAIYYAMAIGLAYAYADRRAFCKVACPVSLVMKPTARYALLRKRPSGNQCTKCGACNRACPMDVNVMSYISAGVSVTDTECILCNDCKHACPSMAIR